MTLLLQILLTFGILLLATLAAAWLRLPLPLIVVLLAPVSIAASLWRTGLVGGREAPR